MIITRVWSEQPGKYFCIASKTRDGEWQEEFFNRAQFKLIPRYIQELKDDNCDVYWCPHGFSKARRLARYAEMPKLMWADLDEVDPRGLGELRPSIAWESSPGRYAALWRLDRPLDEDITNQRLTYYLGADKGGWDLTQVLRVPGTINHKYPSRPRVKMLWQDGPEYPLKDIHDKLPQKKTKSGDDKAPNANSIFKKYREFLTPWARRELLKGNPRRGKRSEVFWKLANEILEAGASSAEAFEILWASPWNKFRDRRDGQQQLEREIEKIYSQKMDGFSPQRDYEAESDIPEDDEGDSEIPGYTGERKFTQEEVLKSFLGIAEPETPRWVVYPYLLRGHITSIEGDPEVGKSWLSLALGASISEGKKRFPTDGWEDKNEQGAVFYFDAENDIGNVAQRMIDSDMFTQVKSAHDQAPFFHVKMKVDFREEEAIDDIIDRVNATLALYKNTKNYNVKPALILFDTFINFSGDTDTNKQSDVMNALGNMKALAEELDCSVVIIRHYGKTQHSNAMHRGMGSTQFAATCRAMVGVHRHPDDPDVRVVTISKSSLASKSDLRTLSYRLEPVFPGSTDINQRDRTRMKWGEWLDLSSQEIVAASAEQGKREQEVKKEREKMMEILDRMFNGHRVKVPASEIRAEFEREAITMNNLARNMSRLGYTPGGKGDKMYYKKAVVTQR